MVPPSPLDPAAVSAPGGLGRNFSVNHLDPLEYFALDGRSVRLKRPLDRDEKDVSSVMFQVRDPSIGVFFVLAPKINGEHNKSPVIDDATGKAIFGQFIMALRSVAE